MTIKPSHQDELGQPGSKRKLWVVSELYYPEETSTGYYMTKIAEGLADDFDVHAICGQPNYSKRGTRAAKYEYRNNVEIERVAGTTLNKNVIIYRLFNMVSLGISVFLKGLVRFRSGDAVLVVTTPPTMPFVVAIAALVKGSQYTLLIHDNYPEILFAVGKVKENSAIVTINNFLNRWLFKNASKIIVVGRDMRELLSEKTKGLDVPIAVIPNWAELETVRPMLRDQNSLLNQLGLSDKFVLLYAGNMGAPNDIDTIIRSARLLKANPQIAFVFLGTGVKEKWLKESVLSNGLENVHVIAPRPRSEQIDFLNACDVGLVSLVTKMKGVSMPSRTYNILAAGKPILALTDPKSELAMVIADDNVGWHIEPGKPEKLAELILTMAADRKVLEEMGVRARRAAVEKYSLDTAISAYRKHLSLK